MVAYKTAWNQYTHHDDHLVAHQDIAASEMRAGHRVMAEIAENIRSLYTAEGPHKILTMHPHLHLTETAPKVEAQVLIQGELVQQVQPREEAVLQVEMEVGAIAF